MTETPAAVGTQKPSHDYHAEAQLLLGHLKSPVKKEIEEHASLALKGDKDDHIFDHADDISVDGLISYTKGKTRVSGARSLKHDGWVTLATSILEGLNVFEIITADRVVSQVSTDHPYENGHVPYVTFLGTQFRNFRVSGFPVTLALNLGICGDRPSGDRTYLRDPNFLYRVKAQTEAIATALGLPKELKEQYDEKLRHIEELINTSSGDPLSARRPVTCSVVQNVNVQSIGEIPGVQIFGHLLVIPEFGHVALGEIEVGEKKYEGTERPCVYFKMTSLNMTLGCVGHGSASAGTTSANGAHKP
jgi:hypothetical protein